MFKVSPRFLSFSRSSIRIPNRRRRSRTVVLFGLLMILFANLSLGLAAELYPRIRDPFYGDKLVKLRTKFRTPHESSIVMLGSSRTGFAFHGRVIEDHYRQRGTNVAAFNFGIPASGPVTHCLYTKRLLRDGVKPTLLLIEILPSMLLESPNGPLEQVFLHGDRLVHRELESAVRFGFDERRVWNRWREGTLTPWYGLRFQLLGRAVQSWIPWQLRYDWSRGSDECGWGTPLREVLTEEERRTATEQARGEYENLLRHWKPGGGAVVALRELLATCRENSVPVKLVLLPEGTTFRSWYSPEVRERLSTFVKSLSDEYGCGVIDAREWLADELFTDGHHQLRSGAEAFSKRLADVLGAAP